MKYAKILLAFALVFACKNETPMEPPPNGSMLEPQWAMYGGNVRHTGNVNTPAYDGIVGPTDSNTVHTKWSVITNDFVGMGGGGIQAPLVADAEGTVYITTSKGLIALHSNGSLKWLFDEGGNSSVAIGNYGTVFYHGRTGYLYALTGDGSAKWKTLTFNLPNIHPLNQTTWMNIVVFETNTVLVGGADSLTAAIVAVNGLDGSLLWRTTFDTFPLIKAVSGDGTTYISIGPHIGQKKFLALGPTGSIKWSLNTEYSIGGYFHVAIDAAGKIYKWPEIIASNGTVIRQDMLGFSVALWQDRYYTTFGLLDTLFCYSLTDDAVVWRDQQDVQFLSNPTVDQLGNVYVVGSGFTSPELIPGYLFVYNKEGELINKFVFDLQNNESLRKPFAPLLLPDGSLVVAGHEDINIACVR